MASRRAFLDVKSHENCCQVRDCKYKRPVVFEIPHRSFQCLLGIIGRDTDLKEQPGPGYICIAHFNPRDIVSIHGITSLRAGTIPTVNLPTNKNQITTKLKIQIKNLNEMEQSRAIFKTLPEKDKANKSLSTTTSQKKFAPSQNTFNISSEATNSQSNTVDQTKKLPEAAIVMVTPQTSGSGGLIKYTLGPSIAINGTPQTLTQLPKVTLQSSLVAQQPFANEVSMPAVQSLGTLHPVQSLRTLGTLHPLPQVQPVSMQPQSTQFPLKTQQLVLVQHAVATQQQPLSPQPPDTTQPPLAQTQPSHLLEMESTEPPPKKPKRSNALELVSKLTDSDMDLLPASTSSALDVKRNKLLNSNKNLLHGYSQLACLSIYFHNSLMYKMMAKCINLLPIETPHGLQSFVEASSANFQAKNWIILKTKVEQMTAQQKDCIVVVGCIKLKRHLYYDITRDTIYGFEEIDGNNFNKNIVASHAYTVMVRGIFEDWTQPIAYSFVEDIHNNNVTRWIDSLIRNLITIGLNVCGLVTDISEHFLAKLNERNVCSDTPFFKVNIAPESTSNDPKRICYFFDYRSMMVAALEALMSDSIHYQGGTARWMDIVAYNTIDQVRKMPCNPRLTKLINAKNEMKLEFKHAMVVFNPNLAKMMSAYKDLGLLPAECQGTIQFILKIHKMYSLLASREYKSRDSRQNIPLHKSDHVNKLLDVYSFLCSIERRNAALTTFVIAAKITVRAVLQFLYDFTDRSVIMFSLKHHNIKCIEEFHKPLLEKVNKQGRHLPVTALQYSTHFIKTYSKCLLKPLDQSSEVTDIDGFLAMCEDTSSKLTVPSNYIKRLETTPVSQATRLVKREDYQLLQIPKENTLIFLAGFVLFKCFLVHRNCRTMKHYMTSVLHLGSDIEQKKELNFYNVTGTDSQHVKDLIEEKFRPIRLGQRRVLMVPSPEFVEYVTKLESTFIELYHDFRKPPRLILTRYIRTLSTRLGQPENVCNCFPSTYLKALYSRLRINSVLKLSNKNLAHYK